MQLQFHRFNLPVYFAYLNAVQTTFNSRGPVSESCGSPTTPPSAPLSLRRADGARHDGGPPEATIFGSLSRFSAFIFGGWSLLLLGCYTRLWPCYFVCVRLHDTIEECAAFARACVPGILSSGFIASSGDKMAAQFWNFGADGGV